MALFQGNHLVSFLYKYLLKSVWERVKVFQDFDMIPMINNLFNKNKSCLILKISH